MTTNPFFASLPALTQGYDLDQKDLLATELFNPYTTGCMEGSLHFMLASQAACGKLANTADYIKVALLERFGLNQAAPTNEQLHMRAYIIGLLGDFSDALYQAEAHPA
ncbi:MAG: hypothetical protein K2Q15_16925 [Burkholderiales bacterium]|jgi:hypothetical protein|nr:hypothetical protein [Burkholderiales bacterium]